MSQLDQERKEEELPDCEVTRETLLSLQVCTRLGQDKAESFARRRLCGTSNGWMLSDRAEQGITCGTYPNRKHYLFDC